jgi:hypothetical protein
VRLQRPVEVGDHLDAVELSEHAGDPLGLAVVANLDRDLPDRPVAPDLDRDHVADDALCVGDPLADLRELARNVRLLDPVHVIDGHRRPTYFNWGYSAPCFR